MRQVRHITETGVGKVAARDLSRALQQMADQHTFAESRPIVCGPAKAVHQRRQKQGRVSHPTGDDDVRVGLQRWQQGIGTQVDVGRNHIIFERCQRLARLHQRQVHAACAQDFQHVVAQDHRHFDLRQTELTRHTQDFMTSLQWIGRTHVGDDANALLHTRGQHGLHAFG